MRVFGIDDIFQGSVFIRHLAENVRQGFLAGKGAEFGDIDFVLNDKADKVFRIRAIDNGEAVEEAQGGGVTFENAVRKRMEGPPGYLVAAGIQQATGPLQHFPGSFAGKRQQ